MVTRKKISAAFVLFHFTMLICLPLSQAALPKYYKEKKVFYNSLSIVLNKYIVSVGNWGLLEGALTGMESILGPTDFVVKSNNYKIEVIIGNSPPFRFSKDEIDTNAIVMIDSVSEVFDSAFEQFAAIDKNDIIHAAIKGMIATLEPNSYFIAPRDLKRLMAQQRGVYSGIGLEITSRDGIFTVVSPYEDSPAFRQGLLPNDRIMAVDGAPTVDLSMIEISDKIRGEKGKPVTLTIERRDWEKPRDITLIRDAISHRTVNFFPLVTGFGYIRISSFLGTTVNDFTAGLENLSKTAKLEGLVIDLRYNPGGLLNQALGLADLFMNTEVIAPTEGRIKSDSETFYAQPGTLSYDYPIVILINSGSASGSEIIAASLRANQRAVLVGERTFGKGLIQTTFPIETGGAIRLTTSMLLTPDGEKIQDRGIEPDLQINPALPENEKSEANNRKLGPLHDIVAIKNDPAVQISLEILKRSLLLQDMSEEELEDLSPEQAALKKRFHGLNKALEEISPHMQIQSF